jgi:hypothetical protein
MDSKKNGIDKIYEMNKAWLVMWHVHGRNEKDFLEQLGIKQKIIDIISVRRRFEDMIETAQDIYKQYTFSVGEKMYLAHYTKGNARQKKFFGKAVPFYTSYTSNLYKELAKSMQNNGVEHAETRRLSKKWSKYPQYVIVGHNPSIEIYKVSNLQLNKRYDGTKYLEWDHPLVNGAFKKKYYEYSV